MKTITYKFSDGTTSTVEVSDEIYALHKEMETEEKRNYRRETRRHQSLERSVDNGWDCEDPNADIETILNNEEITSCLESALNILTEKQRTVLLLYIEANLSFAQIGAKLSIGKDTVKEHFWAAIKKIKKYFSKTPPQNGNFVAFK